MRFEVVRTLLFVRRKTTWLNIESKASRCTFPTLVLTGQASFMYWRSRYIKRLESITLLAHLGNCVLGPNEVYYWAC